MTGGRKIGGFRVLNSLAAGSGSQGVVVCAVCEKPTVPGVNVGDVVALKLMSFADDDSGAREKCENRTRILAAIDHPNVVKYFGCFADEDSFNASMVVVMECLKGETLKDLLAASPGGLDADRALMIVREALSGLSAAEAAGVVHRDIKPSNIFVCRDGSVKLIDFEISRSVSSESTASTGHFAGTFDYMAPEFAREAFRGDARSDIFSMGVVFHEALTGVTPYADAKKEGTTADFAFLSRWSGRTDGKCAIHIKSSVKRILSHADEVLSKALAESPEERYASAAEFLESLGKVCFRELRNGTKVYRLLRVVGKGGFGEVFKARLKSTGEVVAVKHLLKPAYGDRFRREARVMQQVDDTSFVRFIDYFEMRHAGGFEACLVMEFLPGMPGSSLRDAIKRRKGRPLEAADVLKAFARYSQALVTLHAQGIYHRDIKPSNLYYPEDDLGKAAIMDLGIARDANGTATAGQVPGTLDYMPPEVVVGGSRGDAGMDVYALGLCLYEAISGLAAYPRLPTGPDAFRAFYDRAKSGTAPVFSGAAIEAIPGLRELLQEMTAVDPAQRIQDAEQVRRRIVALAIANGASATLRPQDEPATSATLAGDADEVLRLREELARRSKSRTIRWALTAIGLLAVLLAACAAVLWKKKLIQFPASAPEPSVVVVTNTLVTVVTNTPSEPMPMPAVTNTPSATKPMPMPAVTNTPPATKPMSMPAVTNTPPATKPKLVPAVTNTPPATKPKLVPAVTNTPPVTKPKPVIQPVPAPVVMTKTPASAPKADSENTVISDAARQTVLVVKAAEEAMRRAADEKKQKEREQVKTKEMQRAEDFVADVKVRLQAKPIVGRRDRLEKAHGLINDSRTETILAPLGGKVVEELSDLYEAEWKRVRGMVENKTPLPAMIDTGHEVVTLPPGTNQMVTFDGTWTSRRYARIEGYEYVMLPHEQVTFEKFTFAIRTPMLVPLPVPVTVPELESGVTCTISGVSESGVIWTVSGQKVTGTFELYPGEYEVVYEKEDCQRQTFSFKVGKGKPLTLPKPAAWKESGTFGWIGRGFTRAVNGIKNVGDEISVKSGGSDGESRENFETAVELRKSVEGKEKR